MVSRAQILTFRRNERNDKVHQGCCPRQWKNEILDAHLFKNIHHDEMSASDLGGSRIELPLLRQLWMALGGTSAFFLRQVSTCQPALCILAFSFSQSPKQIHRKVNVNQARYVSDIMLSKLNRDPLVFFFGLRF